MVVAAGSKLAAQRLPDGVDGQPAKHQNEQGQIRGTDDEKHERQRGHGAIMARRP